MSSERVRFDANGRPIDAFLSRPDGPGPFPGLIVIHEIWGLDPHIEDVTGRFAAEGFVALAPNLYTGPPFEEAMKPERIISGMQILRAARPEIQRDPSLIQTILADKTPEEQRALTTLMDVQSPARRQAFAEDLRGAFDCLAGTDGVDPNRIGALGFCMGGGLTARLAAIEPRLRAAVIFYGENPPLDRVPEIAASILGIYGGDDARITDTVPDFVSAMERAHKPFPHHIYPGAKHAFFNDTRPQSHHPEAARDAWKRALAFLKKELGAA